MVCIKSHGGDAAKSARYPYDAPEFMQALPNKEMAALIAPSAQSNFNLKKLITGLKKLGIKYVYDVSLGAEMTVALYHDAIMKGTVKKPLITTPCPTVVKYVQINHPALIEHLAPFGSPVHNMAVYVKSLHPDTELVFFSPCVEKKREIMNKDLIKYNVIYTSLQKILLEKNIDLASLPESEFDQSVPAGIATNFSTPGGLKESYLFHYPDTPASSIARMEGAMLFDGYLSSLEGAIAKKDPALPLIVDVLSCEKGCNMGVGCINKSSIGKIEYLVASRSEQSVSDKKANQQLEEFLEQIIKKHDFTVGPYKDLSHLNNLKMPDNAQLQKIYTDMHKLHPRDFRNCAACGYNSCYHMAIAIFNGLNKVQNSAICTRKRITPEKQAIRICIGID